MISALEGISDQSFTFKSQCIDGLSISVFNFEYVYTTVCALPLLVECENVNFQIFFFPLAESMPMLKKHS